MTLAHLTLATRDVHKAAVFFADALLWRRIERPNNIGRPAAWLEIAPGQELHLVEVAYFAPSPFEAEFGRHIAFAFPLAGFDGLKRRLLAHGATLIDPERPTPFARFFFRAPDGYLFEIVPAERQPETIAPSLNAIPGILREYIAGLKAHDVSKIASTVADDLRFITPGTTTVDKQRFLTFLHALYAAFPDWHYDHDEPEWRSDHIAIKWRQSGTHTGTLAFPGMPAVVATLKNVKIPEQYFFYRVRDNQIVEIRPEPIPGGAPQGILEQIGAKGPPL